MNNNIDISRAIIAGLEVFDDREIRVPAHLLEDLATLKSVLKNIRTGVLVIATPDRILPAGAEPPGKED